MKFFDDMNDESRVISLLILCLVAFLALLVVSSSIRDAARHSECAKVLTACYQSGKQDCECKL